jgi:peroxiredoxin Q/BCP
VHLLKLMRTLATTVAATAAGVVHAVMHPHESQVQLKPGDQAPDFALPGSDGRTYRLKDLAGHPVVLAWFPKAFTGG